MNNIEFPSRALIWALFILGIATTVLIAWAFVYWWKKDRHTRERFAFLGGTALVGLATLLILQLSNQVSVAAVIVSLLIRLLNPILKAFDISQVGEFSPASAQLTPNEAVLCVGLIAILAIWFSKVFSNWTGLKSKAQFEQEQNRITPSVIADVRLVLAGDKRKREKLTPHQDDLQPGRSLLEDVHDSRAWHEQAKQLWILKRKKYIFSNEYDAENTCWWGEEKNTGSLVALVCCLKAPDDAAIRRIVDYAEQFKNRKAIDSAAEITVACRDETEDRSSQTISTSIVQWTNKNQLLINLVNFSDYFDDVVHRVERAKLPDSDLTLRDVYAPSRFQMGSSPSTYDLETYINKWLAEDSTRQLALLGEYGQGKSTISLMMSHQLIRKYQDSKIGRIPILIELRGKSPRSLTPEELLATWAYRYSINVPALLQLLMAGMLLIIFEGFDEIDLTGDTDARLNHFRTLWRLSYPGAKIMITGRPNFFLDDGERKRALGIESPHPTRVYCQPIFLAPFNIDQIRDSLRNVEESTREEIVALSEKDAKFYEIVSRPSLLFIVSTLWKRENLSARQQQITSAMVMRLFIRHSYSRQGTKQAERNFMALNTAERAFFMAGIAAYMGVRGFPNQISQHALDAAVQLLLEAIPESVSANATATSNETSIPLKRSHANRFDWENNAPETLEHIKTDVRACGILVTDLSKDGTFKFAHKSFMEFLQAELIADLVAGEGLQKVSANATANATGLTMLSVRDSDEVMSFLAELLRDHFLERGSAATDGEVAQVLFNLIVIGEWTHKPIRMSFRKSFCRIQLAVLQALPKRMRRSHLTKDPNQVGSVNKMHILGSLTMSLTSSIFGAGLITFNKYGIPLSFQIFMLSMFLLGILYGIFEVRSPLALLIWRVQAWRRVCVALKMGPEVVAMHIGHGGIQMIEDSEAELRR